MFAADFRMGDLMRLLFLLVTSVRIFKAQFVDILAEWGFQLEFVYLLFMGSTMCSIKIGWSDMVGLLFLLSMSLVTADENDLVSQISTNMAYWGLQILCFLPSVQRVQRGPLLFKYGF